MSNAKTKSVDSNSFDTIKMYGKGAESNEPEMVFIFDRMNEWKKSKEK